MQDRMPPLDPSRMTPEQKAAAAALAAGPRGGVKGPFIPLLRSPQLMDRMQKVGEYLRFGCVLERRVAEFAMLVVSREWTQQFEWAVHYPLALEAGVDEAILLALAEGRRPAAMPQDLDTAYAFCEELLRTRGVSDATYERTVRQFGERGTIELLGVVGYFTALSMVLNVSRTPPPGGSQVSPLAPLPR